MQQDMFDAPLRLDDTSTHLPDGFELVRAYLTADQASELESRLEFDVVWEQPKTVVWGRMHLLPRLVHWQGDSGAGYKYSGVYRDPSPWHPWILRLRERLLEDYELRFNSVLLNLYRNGQDKVGWHSDDEEELGPAPVIASVSLGGERDFRIRPKGVNGEALNISLRHGDLLIMRAGVQDEWEHCVPVRRNVERPRINLTFRQIFQRR